MEKSLISISIAMALLSVSSIAFTTPTKQSSIKTRPIEIVSHQRFLDYSTRIVRVLATRFRSLIRESVKASLAVKS